MARSLAPQTGRIHLSRPNHPRQRFCLQSGGGPYNSHSSGYGSFRSEARLDCRMIPCADSGGRSLALPQVKLWGDGEIEWGIRRNWWGAASWNTGGIYTVEVLCAGGASGSGGRQERARGSAGVWTGTGNRAKDAAPFHAAGVVRNNSIGGLQPGNVEGLPGFRALGKPSISTFCGRFCNGEITQVQQGSISSMASTASHSFATSYEPPKSIGFHSLWNLVRDQGVGGSNPLSPTKVFKGLQSFWNFQKINCSRF